MNQQDIPTPQGWPLWMRRTLLAAATLTFCSCRAGIHKTGHPEQCPPMQAADCGPCAGPMWCPPPIAPGPPPSDEYLCDGGDQTTEAAVDRNGNIIGLEPEDTIAAYETETGETFTTPSNEVCVYAPRFAAVRQVSGPQLEQLDRVVNALGADLQLAAHDDPTKPHAARQRTQPLANRLRDSVGLFRERQQGGELANEEGVALAIQDETALLLDRIDRLDMLKGRQMAYLAEKAVAAVQWSHDLGVQVIVDNKQAQAMLGEQQAAVTYHIDEPDNPRLAVLKLADRSSAQPGEEIEFTLKYQNTGNVPLQNVMITDHLVTRLAYVTGSQESDHAAAFTTAPNVGGSLVLKWEFEKPLEPGEKGTITFRCRVR